MKMLQPSISICLDIKTKIMLNNEIGTGNIGTGSWRDIHPLGDFFAAYLLSKNLIT